MHDARMYVGNLQYSTTGQMLEPHPAGTDTEAKIRLSFDGQESWLRPVTAESKPNEKTPAAAAAAAAERCKECRRKA